MKDHFAYSTSCCCFSFSCKAVVLFGDQLAYDLFIESEVYLLEVIMNFARINFFFVEYKGIKKLHSIWFSPKKFID